MRSATSIRRLVVGALLPLSVAGCFESEDISVEAVGARYDGSRGICHVEFEVVNNLQEPIELLSIVPVINGQTANKAARTDIRLLNFKIGQSARRTMYYDLDRSECSDPEITDVETGHDCKTPTRICNDDFSF